MLPHKFGSILIKIGHLLLKSPIASLIGQFVTREGIESSVTPASYYVSETYMNLKCRFI